MNKKKSKLVKVVDTLQFEEQKIRVSCRQFNFMNKKSENRIRFKVHLRGVR